MLYRRWVPSTCQLAQVVHQYTKALEMRQEVNVIYLDFSKALDQVSHEKHLFKLECLGIKGSLLAWFRSYLSGRKHRVVIDNDASFLSRIWSPPGINFGTPALLGLHKWQAFLPIRILSVFAYFSAKMMTINYRKTGISYLSGHALGELNSMSKSARFREKHEPNVFMRGIIFLEELSWRVLLLKRSAGIWISQCLSWNQYAEIISSRAQKVLYLLHWTCCKLLKLLGGGRV